MLNMTAGEARASRTLTSKKSKDYRVMSVWNHKTVITHGAAQIACHIKVYQLLMEYIGDKKGADLVFTTSSGERVTHIGLELEKLGDVFGKKFIVTPTMNRKQIATTLSQTGSEADVRGGAMHMSHSLQVHQGSYQQKGRADDAVERYCLNSRG